MKRKRITIITVAYNEAERIQDTIDSVVIQDYSDIEYIIKDGGSTDGTIALVEKAAKAHERIKYISSKDDGIYDAMNIALGRATGDVVEFLNAGDRFASPDVVSKAMSTMAETGSDIVYGDVIYEYPDGTHALRTYSQSCSKRSYYLTGDVINHQVMFTKRSLFRDNLFDTSYKICADREWMLRVGAYTPNRKMTALGFPVAIYPYDGASLIHKDVYKKEADRCIKQHIPWGYPIYAFFELLRSNKILRGLLHRVYKRIFIKG